MDAELIAYFDGRFRESAQQIQGFREEVLGRFEQVEARLDRVEARLEQVEVRLEQVEVRLEQVETRLDRVEVRLEQVETRLDRVEVRLEQVETRLDRVEVRLDEVEVRLDQVNAHLKEVDDRLDKAEETARHTLILVEGLHHQLQLVAESVSGLITRLERLERKGNLTFETFRAWMEPFFNSIEARGREVDARSVLLNVPVKDLDNRVGILEDWVARHGKEALDALANLIVRSRPPSPLPSE